MPARKSEKDESSGATLTVEGAVAAAETPITLDGAPPDTDVTITVATVSGTFDRVVHTDDSGHAEGTVVFPAAGLAELAATVISVVAVAAAEVDVSGSPLREPEPKEE